MAKKPANLIYGLDESPALATTLLLGLQHILALSSAFVFPVILLQETGILPEQAEQMIYTSMIVMGIATILQTLRYGGIGSGYLCPERLSPAYIPASILAVKTGGLPLLAGMTISSCATRGSRWNFPTSGLRKRTCWRMSERSRSSRAF